MASEVSVEESSWKALHALGSAFHLREPGERGALDAILLAATTSMSNVDHAGVNVLRGRVFEPQAVRGQAPFALDELQTRSGIGPCIDSSREQQVIRSDELADEPRWPEYARLAVSLGVHSILCVPMWVDDRRLGSISFYSRLPAAFGPEHEAIGEVLAMHAAVVLSDAQRIENLGLALKNRDIIGQAKGILMAQRRITADDAFELLAGVSQRHNRKLAEVASDVARTGALPE